MNEYSIKFDKLIGYEINKELTNILLELIEKDNNNNENIKILNEKKFTKEFILKYKMKPNFSSCLIVCRCGSFDYEQDNYIIYINNSTLSNIYCKTNKIYLPIYQYCNEYKKRIFANI